MKGYRGQVWKQYTCTSKSTNKQIIKATLKAAIRPPSKASSEHETTWKHHQTLHHRNHSFDENLTLCQQLAKPSNYSGAFWWFWNNFFGGFQKALLVGGCCQKNMQKTAPVGHHRSTNWLSTPWHAQLVEVKAISLWWRLMWQIQLPWWGIPRETGVWCFFFLWESFVSFSWYVFFFFVCLFLCMFFGVFFGVFLFGVVFLFFCDLSVVWRARVPLFKQLIAGSWWVPCLLSCFLCSVFSFSSADY